MSVEKAIANAHDDSCCCDIGLECPACTEVRDALYAAIRSEQVAHVARCECCHSYQNKGGPLDEGCVHCDAGEHRHPYTDPRCKPLDLHDAEVRLEEAECLHTAGCTCFADEVDPACQATWDEARAAVAKLKGRES